MKILIATHHLDEYAGSEIFTFNIAKELKKKGNDVSIYSPILGRMSKIVKENNIKVTNNILDYKKEKFDIIHAQHNITAIIVRSVFPEIPMIYFVHGILPELEQPPSVRLGISKYLVVSEEIKNHLNKKYNVSGSDIEIVRNYIDTKKFYCKESIKREKPKQLLIVSNHYHKKVKNIIESSCQELDINVTHIGLPENPVLDVENYINKSDIVVTLGRGVLEGMACEKNIIVFDKHGGDGFLDINNYFEIRKNNFSGRRYKKDYGKNEFKKEILKYDYSIGKKLRKIVLKNHTDNIIDDMEKIYNETTRNQKHNSQIQQGQLYNEINFLEKNYNNILNIYKKTVNDLRKIEDEINTKNNLITSQNKDLEILNKLNNTFLGRINWTIHNPKKFMKKYISKHKNV